MFCSSKWSKVTSRKPLGATAIYIWHLGGTKGCSEQVRRGDHHMCAFQRGNFCAYNYQRDKVFSFVICKRVREPDCCLPRKMQVGEQASMCLPKRQRASHPNLHNFPSTSHHTALRCRTNIRPVRQQDTKLPREVLAKYCSENSHPFHLSQRSQASWTRTKCKVFWSFQRCVTF